MLNFAGEVRTLNPREPSSILGAWTIWGYNSKVEYPAFNRSIRVRFSVPLPYESTLPTSSGEPVELVVVLQASVFLYGKLILM